MPARIRGVLGWPGPVCACVRTATGRRKRGRDKCRRERDEIQLFCPQAGTLLATKYEPPGVGGRHRMYPKTFKGDKTSSRSNPRLLRFCVASVETDLFLCLSPFYPTAHQLPDTGQTRAAFPLVSKCRYCDISRRVI